MAHSIRNIKTGSWVFILIYWIAATIFEGGAPTLQTFDYTFQRPITSPGTLQSTRWSFYWWVIALFVTVWIPPLTLAFALDDTKGKATVESNGVGKGDGVVFWRIIMHIVLVALLLMWFTAVYIYGLTLYANANTTGPGNWQNPANDPRWCCVFFSLANHATTPSFPCVNTVACSPGISADMLVVNPAYSFTLWFGFVFIIFLIVDILLVTCLVWPAYRAYALGSEKRGNQAQTTQTPLKNAYLERLL